MSEKTADRSVEYLGSSYVLPDDCKPARIQRILGVLTPDPRVDGVVSVELAVRLDRGGTEEMN